MVPPRCVCREKSTLIGCKRGSVREISRYEEQLKKLLVLDFLLRLDRSRLKKFSVYRRRISFDPVQINTKNGLNAA